MPEQSAGAGSAAHGFASQDDGRAADSRPRYFLSDQHGWCRQHQLYRILHCLLRIQQEDILGARANIDT